MCANINSWRAIASLSNWDSLGGTIELGRFIRSDWPVSWKQRISCFSEPDGEWSQKGDGVVFVMVQPDRTFGNVRTSQKNVELRFLSSMKMSIFVFICCLNCDLFGWEDWLIVAPDRTFISLWSSHKHCPPTNLSFSKMCWLSVLG